MNGKKPWHQQGTSSCGCRHLLLETICPPKKEQKRIKEQTQRHKGKHTQVVFLNIHTFSLIDKKSIEKNINCKNHLTDEFLL